VAAKAQERPQAAIPLAFVAGLLIGWTIKRT
jgi:hypothetical protein